ncbi:hypothetical protein N7495_002466 [Penicillium taxi]|uniref:uncharacterized protein n=1 Tax=Penicillium taxi TaxID=168475 RepID=UPI00254571FE|nr:uncharacterized protein N7495_002466 [Penicillium taxi]KAJ5901938.1 hypothetical protein N7495_002466 [Penicillium taxi]
MGISHTKATVAATSPATNLAVSTTSSTQSTSASTSTSTTTPTQASSKSTGHSGISGGAIAGIVIGCVAAIVIGLLLLFRKKILTCMGYSRNSPLPPQEPTTEVYNHGQPQSPVPTAPTGWNTLELAGSGVGYKQPGATTALSDSTPSQLAGSESGLSSPVAQLEGSEYVYQSGYSGIGRNPPMHEMP